MLSAVDSGASKADNVRTLPRNQRAIDAARYEGDGMLPDRIRIDDTDGLLLELILRVIVSGASTRPTKLLESAFGRPSARPAT